jgi:hypothetical protein
MQRSRRCLESKNQTNKESFSMQQISKSSPFPRGQVVATPAALAALEEAGQRPQDFLARHVHGDWGDLCDEDRNENRLSLEQGFRLLNSYRACAGDTKM